MQPIPEQRSSTSGADTPSGAPAARTAADPPASLESLFLRFINSIPLGACALDPEGIVIEANGVALETSGLDRAAVVGKHLADTYWWKGLRQSRKELLAALERARAGERQLYRTHVRTRGSLLRLVKVMIQPLDAGSGHPQVLLVSVTDVNDQLEASPAAPDGDGKQIATALLHAPVAIARQDADLRYTWVHKPLPGLTPEAMLGQTDAALLRDAQSAETLTNVKQRVLATGEGTRCEIELRLTDGMHCVDLTVDPVLDPGGSVIGVLSTAIDVTSHKQLEHSLRRSRARLAQVTQTRVVGIVFRDPEGHLHDANEGFTAITGYGRRDLLDGKVAWRDMVFPEAAAEEAAAAAVLASDGAVKPYEIEIVHKSGARIPVLVSAAQLSGPFHEQVVYLVDVTERKQLAAQQAQWATFVENSEDAILSYTLDGRVTQWNRGAHRIYGYQAAEMVGRPATTLIPPDRHSEFEHMLARLRHGERLAQFETVRADREGKRLHVSISAAPVLDASGNPVGVASIERDITDRIRAGRQLAELNQNLEKRIQERTQSLMRNQEQLRQLSSELALAEQRERRRLAGDLHDYLAQLLVACRFTLSRLKGVVRSPMGHRLLAQLDDSLNDGLTYTRSLVAQLSPVILYEAGLQAALAWLAEQMPRYGLDVTVVAAQPIGTLAENDAVIAFQSVREVLFNIIKHARTDKADLILDQDDQWIRISVSDHGAGFDPAAAESAAASGRFGLFSIRERLEMLGGRLEIEAAPSKGTTVRLVLPRETGEAVTEPIRPCPEPDRMPPPQPSDAARHRRIRILLVDDHEVVRKGLRSLLEMNTDLQVIGEASDGKEAVERAQALDPDVIVMDVNMPRVNGIEATRQIRRDRPGVAVVALSVFENSAMARAMRIAGACAYLTKGGPPEELFDAIRAAFRQYRQA